MAARISSRLHPYHLEGDNYDLFVASPDGEEARPAVLVVHGWAGRDRFIEGKARQFAQLGYVGVGIDLYGLGRRGRARRESEALMTELVSDPGRLQGRLARALEEAQSLDEVDAKRVAMVGYCFGGSCALLAARMGLGLGAAISLHGLLDLDLGSGSEARPDCPLLVLNGADDPLVPPDVLRDFEKTMQTLGAELRVVSYPGAKHAFAIPKASAAPGNAYHPEADQASWQETKLFLSRHIKHNNER